nr:MAG TPA: hypothetical protein [Caudoviricetes sp.]
MPDTRSHSSLTCDQMSGTYPTFGNTIQFSNSLCRSG